MHRIGGPAITYSDEQMEWYKDGLLHNEERPSRTYLNDKYQPQYYLFDEELTKEEFDKLHCESGCFKLFGKDAWFIDSSKLKVEKSLKNIEQLNSRKDFNPFFDALKSRVIKFSSPEIFDS